MYNDFSEEGRALAPYLENLIADKNFSSLVDKNYLQTNSIHLFEVLSNLINKGFFDRFREQEIINFLDIGCNCAHLAMILPELIKLLVARGIEVKFKYLGIDILRNLMRELQEKMPIDDGFFFRGLDASNKTAVSMAMTEIGMPKADFVLIKRPVAFGLAWSKNLPLGIAVTLPLGVIINPSPIEAVKSVILSFILTRSVYNVGNQYGQCREILGGEATENYQGAMVLTTHSQWLEQLNTMSIMRNSGRGNFTPFTASSPGGRFLYYEQYFLLIDNYTRQERWTLDNFINSDWMALITLGYGLYRLARTKSHFWVNMEIVFFGVLQSFTPLLLYALEPVISFLLTALEQGQEIFPSVMQLGCSLVIINNFAKINPSYTQFAMLLASLPMADAITSKQNFAVTQWLEPKILLQTFQCVGLIKIFSAVVMKLGKQIQNKLKDYFSFGWCNVNVFPKVRVTGMTEASSFPVTEYSR